jgi:RNA recognition motif-containing protein
MEAEKKPDLVRPLTKSEFFDAKKCYVNGTKEFNIDFKHDVKFLSRDSMLKNKMSDEEIREIDRFRDYSPGEESRILFVKNLGKFVSHEEVVALFLAFQNEESLRFKILDGKMKGQAFVTFPNSRSARHALESVNGFLLNGRPVIVQFGKN